MDSRSQVSKFPTCSLFRQNRHPRSAGNWPLFFHGGTEQSQWGHLKGKLFSFRRQVQPYSSGEFQFTAHFSPGIKAKINTLARPVINCCQRVRGFCWWLPRGLFISGPWPGRGGPIAPISNWQHLRVPMIESQKDYSPQAPGSREAASQHLRLP